MANNKAKKELKIEEYIESDVQKDYLINPYEREDQELKNAEEENRRAKAKLREFSNTSNATKNIKGEKKDYLEGNQPVQKPEDITTEASEYPRLKPKLGTTGNRNTERRRREIQNNDLFNRRQRQFDTFYDPRDSDDERGFNYSYEHAPGSEIGHQYGPTEWHSAEEESYPTENEWHSVNDEREEDKYSHRKSSRYTTSPEQYYAQFKKQNSGRSDNSQRNSRRSNTRNESNNEAPNSNNRRWNQPGVEDYYENRPHSVNKFKKHNKYAIPNNASSNNFEMKNNKRKHYNNLYGKPEWNQYNESREYYPQPQKNRRKGTLSDNEYRNQTNRGGIAYHEHPYRYGSESKKRSYEKAAKYKRSHQEKRNPGRSYYEHNPGLYYEEEFDQVGYPPYPNPRWEQERPPFRSTYRTDTELDFPEYARRRINRHDDEYLHGPMGNRGYRGYLSEMEEYNQGRRFAGSERRGRRSKYNEPYYNSERRHSYEPHEEYRDYGRSERSYEREKSQRRNRNSDSYATYQKRKPFKW